MVELTQPNCHRSARMSDRGGRIAQQLGSAIKPCAPRVTTAGRSGTDGRDTRSAAAPAKIHCLKAFGERIAARAPARQTAEIHVRVALMNRCNARGAADIFRVS